MSARYPDAEIRDRIRWLERQLLKLDGFSWLTDRVEMRRRCDAIDAAIRLWPDASLRHNTDGSRLRMLGIATSCTAGSPGIYSNWLGRARIEAEQMEAGD